MFAEWSVVPTMQPMWRPPLVSVTISLRAAQSQTKIDATLRNYFETKRLAIIGALAKTTKASFSNARFAGMDTNAVSWGLLIEHKPSKE